jgi:hypothetical protein
VRQALAGHVTRADAGGSEGPTDGQARAILAAALHKLETGARWLPSPAAAEAFLGGCSAASHPLPWALIPSLHDSICRPALTPQAASEAALTALSPLFHDAHNPRT